MNFCANDLRLYAVTDRSWLNGRTLVSCVEEAIDGGFGFIQLREKNLELEKFLKEGTEICRLCKSRGIKFVINDNIDIAVKCGADGVHVGQSDSSVSEARRILGNNKIVGASVQTVEQALTAQEQGADYLGVGAIFRTGTKKDADSVSIETLTEICKAVKIPVVAIGGICKENIPKLNKSGIAGIAVVSAIFAEKDIKSAARELSDCLYRAQIGICL